VPQTNRLAQETSPYLRQHADNPVYWQPWDDEAMARARDEDKPILLSVGYSACHWCHVMAHESFEDPATAAVMNDGFVCIKVDREERPDIDAIYMEAVQAIAGSGGWPMTVFLLPDGRPFFGGTYFPRDRFVDLMGRVTEAWRTRRAGLEDDATQLAAAIRSGSGLPGSTWAAETKGELDGALDVGVEALVGRFDPEWGGFGGAPKFPQPCMLELLLHAWARTGDDVVLDVVTTSLDAMASGGIYDHLGGGFARYATDRRWLVPHFEKMLYDNALLVRVYLHAWQATGLERYRQVVTETVDYLLSPPVRQAAGGFSSAEDADSEGVEGRYYVWDLDRLEAVGGPEAVAWYGASSGGNWEGTNVLWRPERADLLRPDAVEQARVRLLADRDTRVRPGLDDKVLTEWNAMAVAALAEAGAVLDRPGWVEAAAATARFLLDNLRNDSGRWLRSWQQDGADPTQGRARHLAYAADHAWLVEAFTRLAEATGRASWITEAQGTADRMLELFWDDEAGGFHTAGSDAEALIARTKDTYDGAVPSANSVAATALLRLSALTGDLTYRDRTHTLLDAMGPALAKAPAAFSAMVAAADLAVAGVTEVAITGDRPDLVAAVRASHHPEVVLAWGERYPSPIWEGRQEGEGAGQAYVCRDWACRAPVADAAALAAALGSAPLG
jgi:uncharacterized protein YyaL (SSP411 family)